MTHRPNRYAPHCRRQAAPAHYMTMRTVSAQVAAQILSASAFKYQECSRARLGEAWHSVAGYSYVTAELTVADMVVRALQTWMCVQTGDALWHMASSATQCCTLPLNDGEAETSLGIDPAAHIGRCRQR